MILSIVRKTVLALVPSFEIIGSAITWPAVKKIRSVHGIEVLQAAGPAILAFNHVGPFADGWMIVGLIWRAVRRRISFLTRRDRVWNLFGDDFVTSWAGLIPFDEDRKTEMMEALIDRLRMGEVIGIFPEGIKNTKPELLKGKTGMIRLALETNVPVIPVGLTGPKDFYKSFFGIIRFFFLMKPSVDFVFGKPMRFQKSGSEVTKEQLDDMTRKVMIELAKLCQKTYPY